MMKMRRMDSIVTVGDHLFSTMNRPTASQATRRALTLLSSPEARYFVAQTHFVGMTRTCSGRARRRALTVDMGTGVNASNVSNSWRISSSIALRKSWWCSCRVNSPKVVGSAGRVDGPDVVGSESLNGVAATAARTSSRTLSVSVSWWSRKVSLSSMRSATDCLKASNVAVVGAVAFTLVTLLRTAMIVSFTLDDGSAAWDVCLRGGVVVDGMSSAALPVSSRLSSIGGVSVSGRSPLVSWLSSARPSSMRRSARLSGLMSYMSKSACTESMAGS